PGGKMNVWGERGQQSGPPLVAGPWHCWVSFKTREPDVVNANKCSAFNLFNPEAPARGGCWADPTWPICLPALSGELGVELKGGGGSALTSCHFLCVAAEKQGAVQRLMDGSCIEAEGFGDSHGEPEEGGRDGLTDYTV
ncbi:hypothetical protein NQZ68_033917, partial [Dissostichus eleginoides]